MTTLSAALAAMRGRFSDAGLPDAAIEARLLIGGLLGLSSTEVFVSGDRLLSDADAARLEEATARRLSREPVHRILGKREFYGMELRLSSETLEPRPDTEILVDTLLPALGQIVADKGSARLLDMGTGTGAILLALLQCTPAASGVGSDISADALATASGNATDLGFRDRFDAVQSHWFDKITGRFDIIASNPPYIRSNVIPTLEPEVRDFDPPAALDGGSDGLEAYRAIAKDAGAFLERNGIVAVEIGFDQKHMVTAIFLDAGFRLEQAVRDYGGNDRVLVFKVDEA